MYTIYASDLNKAYKRGMNLLFNLGRTEDSRNGEVLVVPAPVATVFSRPYRRVLFDSTRNANPFFHVIEAVWMLAGRRDVDFIADFVKRMRTFSDDEKVLQGTYGYRWRYQFGRDQLVEIQDELISNPQSRRCVLSMWDPQVDLCSNSKDIPCNTHIYFRVNNGALDMTVCNRSNDIYWGLYGANAVHLSILHEVMARSCEYDIGVWTQISNNYHLYPANLPLPLKDMIPLLNCGHEINYYTTTHWVGTPIGQRGLDINHFLTDCQRFCEDPRRPVGNMWIDQVVYPMYMYWKTRDEEYIDKIIDPFWQVASRNWHNRRNNAS